MRVVAGRARGRRLVAPEGATTRPTSDRVREALFNSLGSAGVVQDARVVDLFAGTGALGIEALSRGATHAWFVERDRRAVAALRSNLESTGTLEDATVVVGSVDRVLAAGGQLESVRADLVLADPPYAFDGWPGLLASVFRRWPECLVVAESDRPVAAAPEADGGSSRGGSVVAGLVDTRRYGTTVVSLLRSPASAASEAEEQSDPGSTG